MAQRSGANLTERSPREAAVGRDWPHLIPALLAVAGVLCYVNTLANPFIWDDVRFVFDPVLRELSDPLAILKAGGRRPLVHLSLAINQAIDGVNPATYHLLNIAVHVLAGMALYGLVRRLLLITAVSDRRRRLAPWLAGAIGLVWIVHPLNTQAVAYVIQRSESMMGLFMLLTLYCLVRAAECARQARAQQRPRHALADAPAHSAAPRRWAGLWGALAVLACAAGMASKEVMVVAPLVALLMDRAFLAGTFMQALRERGAIYLGLCATWALLPIMGLGGLTETQASAGFGSEAIRPMTYLLSQGEVIVHYLRLTVWPHPLVLDYAWRPAYPDGHWLGPVLVVLGLVAAAGVGVVRNRAWGFLLAAFLLILGPTSSIMPIADLVMEHRMYLPLAALVAGAVLGGELAIRRLASASAQPMVGGVLLAAVVLPLAAATVARNYDYRSAITLWRTNVERSPHARAYHNLASAYQDAGRIDEALRAYERELEMLPPASLMAAAARNNLAEIWLQTRQPEQAIVYLRTGLEHHPDDVALNYNLGRTLLMVGQLDEAERALRRTLELDPTHASAWNQLGVAHEFIGKPEEAEAAFTQAVTLDPELGEAHYNLGRFRHLHRRDDQGAVRSLRRAHRLGYNPAAGLLLARLLATSADPQVRDGYEALEVAQRSFGRAEHHDPVALDTLAAAYAATDDFDNAADLAMQALRLAREQGRPQAMIDEIASRLSLYRQSNRYQQPASR